MRSPRSPPACVGGQPRMPLLDSLSDSHEYHCSRVLRGRGVLERGQQITKTGAGARSRSRRGGAPGGGVAPPVRAAEGGIRGCNSVGACRSLPRSEPREHVKISLSDACTFSCIFGRQRNCGKASVVHLRCQCTFIWGQQRLARSRDQEFVQSIMTPEVRATERADHATPMLMQRTTAA